MKAKANEKCLLLPNKIKKILNGYGITVEKRKNDDVYFQFCHESKIIKVPANFDISNEIHLIKIFHELGHYLYRKQAIFPHDEVYFSSQFKYYKKYFFWTMKNEIKAWKLGIKVYEKLFKQKITDCMKEEIVRCIFSYYAYKGYIGKGLFSYFDDDDTPSYSEVSEKIKKIVIKGEGK